LPRRPTEENLALQLEMDAKEHVVSVAVGGLVGLVLVVHDVPFAMKESFFYIECCSSRAFSLALQVVVNCANPSRVSPVEMDEPVNS